MIDKLHLDQTWDLTPHEAYQALLSKVDAQNVRGTDLINIEVYDESANLAAQIADEIALAYATRRNKEASDRAQRALDVLKGQIAAQKKKLENSRVRMFDIMEKHNIADLTTQTAFWDRGGTVDTGVSGVVREAIHAEYLAETSIADLETTIEALTNLSGDELIGAAMDFGITDPTLTQKHQEYLNQKLLRTELLGMGMGAKHPKVLAVDQKLSQLQDMLEAAVTKAKSTLQTKLEMARETARNARETKEEKEKSSVQDRRKTIEYAEAKKDYDLNRDILNRLEETLQKEEVDAGSSTTPITFHEKAVVPTSPARPNVKLHIIVGVVLGMILGVVLAFFLEYLDTSVKTLEDVERYLEVPVLAVIPKDVGVLHKQSGLSPDAEAYRILRTNIEFNRKSADANSITVVSGGAGEGKSTTLVNLAYVCAQGGYNTLMIDGDLRRPKLHTFFDINNSVGLTNYLTTDLMLEDVILQTPVENLYFMPSGILPADAAGILNSRRMSELIADVKSRFDLVLIDSPPILGVSDASVLASEVDLTMIVIQHRKLPRGMLIRVKQAIQNVGGNLLGVVLNNVDIRSDSQYQYYTSYYTYYSPTNTEPKPKPRDASRDGAGAEVASAAPPSQGGDGDF